MAKDRTDNSVPREIWARLLVANHLGGLAQAIYELEERDLLAIEHYLEAPLGFHMETAVGVAQLGLTKQGPSFWLTDALPAIKRRLSKMSKQKGPRGPGHFEQPSTERPDG